MDIRVQESLSAYFRRRRHTALLIAIVVAFAIRPLIGDAGSDPIAFSLALLALMLVALYTIHVDELVGEQASGRTTVEGSAKRTAKEIAEQLKAGAQKQGWIYAERRLPPRPGMRIHPRVGCPPPEGPMWWLSS